MTGTSQPARSIETLADEYARSRRRQTRSVSMAAAVRAIKALAPETEYTDDELANVIAASAVRYGHAVDFDIKGS